jgi:hypothetical protein
MLIKDIFGKPEQGIHKYRIMGVAFVDTFFLFIGAIILSYYSKISFFITFIALFFLGIFCHYLFSVDTTIHRFLVRVFKKITTIIRKNMS